MLKQRVVTALIMAGLFLAAVAFLSLPWLALMFGILICLGAWEWSRLCGWNTPLTCGLYALAIAVVLSALYQYNQLGAAPQREQVQPFLGLACLWWSLALLWVKGYPGSAAFWRNRVMRNLMGVLVLAPAWMAAVYLVSFPRGGGLIVVMVLIVAAADIGAYFSGKAWGRHKLAEAVSPKKTWEGFWGGMSACVALALLLWSQLPNQQAHVSLAAVLVVCLATALASVVGDLTVSMVKREAGVKDSGSLLPGHGGVLDRLDSLCGAAPVFALGLLLAGVVAVQAGRRMVSVLGSTGSIGVNTLDVIAGHPDRFGVYGLAANSSVAALLAQCLVFRPRYAVMMDAAAAEELRRQLPADCGTEVLQGEAGLSRIAAATEVDTVMAAIVGAAGLPSALAAARAGKTLLLANKESLVMGGHLLMQAVQQSGARLLPIDSEHNAIFQCMPVNPASAAPSLAGVDKVLLTASGGPFRQWSRARMDEATPDEACAHPNWSMGRKISVDSASLMNKGLELIEACWIFDLAPGQIEVVVHPQSIIHSMVQYRDGSVLAQMGNPDMRTPIAYGLGWPERLVSGVAPLDLIATARLDFEAPDEGRFPCLRLAREAVAAGGTAMAICNAANEIAVAAFLDGMIRFTAIPLVIEQTLERMTIVEPTSLAVVESADVAARSVAGERVATLLRGGRRAGVA